MAVSRLICPDCETVLRPAKPVPEGKQVKCPKCGASFTAFAFDEEPSEAPTIAKKPVKPPPSAVKKKANPAKPEPAKPTPKPTADDDEDGGTYGVIKEEEPEEEEEEEEEDFDDDDDDDDDRRRSNRKRKTSGKKKPDLSHVPDLSSKDPRGPAQEAVVSPSNMLMITGIVGFVGWLAFLVMIVIPAVFPLEDEDKVEKDKPKQVLAIPRGVGGLSDQGLANEKPTEKEIKESKGPAPSFITVMGYDFALFANYDWWMFILCLLPIFLGMGYAFTIAMGAAKIQNLDSREWGIVASIMAMLPLNAGGVLLVTLIVLEQFVLGNFFDDPNTIFIVEIVWIVLICLGEAAAGVWSLLVLMREDVKEGFEFIPEGGK
jgi:hypothetical protein